ncbi:MAG: glutathione S-transferase family protein [Gammaproteobacteria bacterium]|nr:MAG: glutathione S-transferase family protein [Gammaproteobacteria bacterium]
MLVDGKWNESWRPVQAVDEDGRFLRQASVFRNWITPDGAPGATGAGGFDAASGRYHLYVALICPWASRTLMVRQLKGLADVISVSAVEPFITEFGWRFGDYPGAGADEVNGAEYLHEVYTLADPGYTGRVTVPVLWDKQRRTIVSNESADIIRMLNTAFGELADTAVDLRPASLAAEIDAVNEELYGALNNGVYQAGFASSQMAYEEAVDGVFAALDRMEERLSDGRAFLLGDDLTESDIRLFVTTVRFDATYHGLFKCNLRKLADYPYVSEHLQRVLDLPGIWQTVNMDHIKRGYYAIKALNPNGIVPTGPVLPFLT